MKPLRGERRKKKRSNEVHGEDSRMGERIEHTRERGPIEKRGGKGA